MCRFEQSTYDMLTQCLTIKPSPHMQDTRAFKYIYLLDELKVDFHLL